MPDPLELPGMLRAVIPLVRRQRHSGFGRSVVDELVAHARCCTGCGRLLRIRSRLMPRFAAVFGSLNDLPEPTGSLGCINPIRVRGRPFEMVDFPAGKVGTADLPFFPLAVRGKYECALACANQYA